MGTARPPRPFPLICQTKQLRIKCPVCGQKKVTYLKIEKTVDPAHKNADGRPKTREDVTKDVQYALELWVTTVKRNGMTCVQCRDANVQSSFPEVVTLSIPQSCLPAQIVIELEGDRFTFLESTPARLAADRTSEALGRLLAWVEKVHDMKDDGNVPATILEAREAFRLASLRPEPVQALHAQRELAPELVKVLRHVLLSYSMTGELPDEVVAQAAALLLKVQACGPERRETALAGSAESS